MKFRIARRSSDIEISISFDNEEEFDEALSTVLRLEDRRNIAELKHRTQGLWIGSGESMELNSSITDSVHRVAICLLRYHPENVRTSQIAQDIELADSTVSNILNGTYGSAGHMFAKTGTTWGLSSQGMSELIEEILTQYLG